jgi:ribosome-associated toxin RatA of RatAB toxin-antitoxin module
VLTGSCSAELGYAIERCWGLVADIEHAPRWQRRVERVDVLERDERGRPLICEVVTDAKVTRLNLRVRMSYEEPLAVRWSLVEPNDLEALDGSWELEPLAGDRTRVTYSLAVDPGPIGAFAARLERVVRPIVIGHQPDELARALARGL